MAIELTMPKLSDTMEEGKILKWLVKEGDQVSSGDIIAEIETDKADMEYETIDDGTVLRIVVGEGETAPVGKLIAVIGEEGEEVDAGAAPAVEKKEETAEEAPVEEAELEEQKIELTAKDREVLAPAEDEKPEAAKEPVAGRQPERAASPQPAAGGAVKASPVARKLADAAGVDIKTIRGSGPDGRVIKRDIENALGGELPRAESEFAKPKETAPAAKPVEKPVEEKPAEARPAKPTPSPAPAPAPVVAKLEGRREPMSGMRKTIAKRLVQSKVEVPHFYLSVEVDMDELMLARASLNELEGVKLSVNDFIIKACAQALLQHAMVNAHVEGDEIVYHDTVDIGMAVAIDEGLITPYIRAAHTKSLSRIAAEARELAERARNRKLKPEEYSGGSFTVSNLGMFGIDHFTAIINPPESTILAVGAAREVPVVVDDEIDIAWRMNMTLSCDHRIVDGATGARFLQTLVGMLENPVRMLL